MRWLQKRCSLLPTKRKPSKRAGRPAGPSSWKMPPLKVYHPTGPVPTRTAPAPLLSGMSRRKMPPASVAAISSCVDHWMSKCTSEYEHPAQRWLFEMGHEVQALLKPLLAEEARKDARLKHLEQLLSQWNECATPRALWWTRPRTQLATPDPSLATR